MRSSPGAIQHEADHEKVRVLDGSCLRRVLDAEVALRAARESARLVASGGVELSRAEVGVGRSWFRVLVGALPAVDLLGYKAFGGVRGDGPRFLCHLFRLSTGQPLAILDAKLVTALRTSAHAALAVRHVFGEREVAVGVVGSGAAAAQGLRMLATTCRIGGARVWSPREESRRRFAAEMSAELAIDVDAVGDAGSALRGADVGYSATTSRGQVVFGGPEVAGLEMLATIGSTTPAQREVDGAVFHEARRVVLDTPDALEASGDLLDARASRGPLPETGTILLGAFLREPAPAAGDGLLVYKSIGSAEQDLVLAYRAYQAAAERGLGELVADPAAAG